MLGHRLFAVTAAASLILTALVGCSAAPEGPALTLPTGIAVITDADGNELEEAPAIAPAGTRIAVPEVKSLAELVWPDGSITRLGGSSSMTVQEGEPRGALSTFGLSWHRVSEQGSGSYSLLLDDGTTLSAQGTGFAVNCALDGCELYVFDGEVAVGGTVVGEKQAASIGGNAATDVRPLVWTEFLSTDWAQQNSDLDGDRYPSVETLYADADPMLAMVSGKYSGHRILDSVECAGGECAIYEQNWQLGVPAERSYGFDIECDDLGFPPCTGVAITEHHDLMTGQTREDRVKLVYDGSEYTWKRNTQVDICEFSDGSTEGRSDNTIVWSVTPTAAEFINGQFVATELSGTTTATLETVSPVYTPGCEQFETEFTEIGTLSVTLNR